MFMKTKWFSLWITAILCGATTAWADKSIKLSSIGVYESESSSESLHRFASTPGS